MKIDDGFLVVKAMVLMLAITVCSCSTRYPSADLIITGTIWTGNTEHPWAEAMAISGDTLLAVGLVKDVMAYKGDTTELVALSHEFVAPGFIDCHVHFLNGGFNLSSVQLRDAKTPEEFAERIKRFAEGLEPGVWILGGDWDHENWGGELPVREWIDKYTPNNPVWVTRLDGHMSLANTAALRFAGIDRNVKDIPGGTIVRDKNGNLTGIFKDNATPLIDSKIPAPSASQVDQALQAAMLHVASQGVTSVHHMAGNLEALLRARQQEKLITRIYAMRPLAEWQMLKAQVERDGRGDHWLKLGGLKGFVDGSLGSHTAAFFDPFTDVPTDSGFFINTRQNLYEWISGADQAGLQVMVHAIGDKAIHTLLDIYQQVESENGKRDRRFRMEHAQHIAPADFPRFAQLGIVASMQPYHAIDDGRWAEKVVGTERSKSTYAFRSLIDANAKVAFGSDWPVAPASPLQGIYAATTRQTLDGQNPDGWIPDQKITVEQALTAYTSRAAYASFEEDLKGTLEAGKLADFIIIDRDITRVATPEIRDAKVLKTYVGGRLVFHLE